MSDDYYVYAISKPGNANPDYIGKGRGRRAYVHLTDCLRMNDPEFNQPFYIELRTNYPRNTDGGISADIEKLYLELSEDEAFRHEVMEIEKYGLWIDGTGCLLNMTRGGEGTVRPYKPNEKLSLASKGIKKSRRHAEAIKIGKRKSTEKLFCQFELCTGKIRRIFRNQSEVEEYGYRSTNVQGVLNGINKSHRGWGWRYLTPEEVGLLISTKED